MLKHLRLFWAVVCLLMWWGLPWQVHAQVLTLAADTASAPIHTVVNVFATVQGGSGGSVLFLDGGAPLVTVPLTSTPGSTQGLAVLSIASLSQGTHTLTATYQPPAGPAQGASAPVSVTVTGLQASFAPSPDTIPAIAAKPFGMDVPGLPSDASGTLTFSEGGTGLGSVAIAGLAGATHLYQAFGDSITEGATLAHQSQSYPLLVGAALGFSVTDYGTAGDMACDTLSFRILRKAAPPATQVRTPLYSLMIGTTDVDFLGSGVHEQVYRACHQATLAWLGVPSEYKVVAGDARIHTQGTWTHQPDASDATYGTYFSATGTGTITFPVTTSGGPIYLWFLQSDRYTGTFTVAVDGVPTGLTYNSTPPAPIGTLNNQDYNGMVMARLPVGPGAHQVVVSHLTGTVAILGVGTPPSPGVASVHPVVLVADLPLELTTNPAVPPATMLPYLQDIQDDIALLQPDGLDLRYTPTRTFMLGTPAEMNDQAHPSPLGQQHLAAAFEDVLAGVPTPAYTTFASAATPYALLTLNSTGTHTISTAYSGDSTYAPSSVQTSVSVVPRSVTSTSFTMGAGPYPANAPIQLSAAVQPAGASGTITFQDGNQYLGSGQVQGGQVAVPVNLTPGTHPLTAGYSGDPSYAPSVSPLLNLQVVAGKTTVTLGGGPVEAAYGTPLSLTAAVTPASATGAVTLNDSFTPAFAGTVQPPVAAATLMNGVATLSTAALLPGTHRLNATYGGDTDDEGSSSAVSVTVVDPIATATTLTVPATLSYGGASQLTASVSAGATGPVVFRDGSVLLGQASLGQNGQASLSVTTLNVGNHALTATYAGDATHGASGSGVQAEQVVQAASTTGLSVSAASVQVGQAVVVQVQVSPAFASGTVVIRDATAGPLGQATIVNGQGSVTLAGLRIGSYQLVGQYGGDGNTLGSISGPGVALQVTAVPAAVTLSVPGSVPVGAPLTLTASVQPAAATGQIRFLVDGSQAGTAVLSGGMASLQSTGLVVGAHAVQVVYGGDSTYAGATSAAGNVSVTVDPTVTALSLAQSTVTGGTMLGFNVRVSSGYGMPGGLVQVRVGSQVVASGSLNASGAATLNATASQLGTFSAVAYYGGDAMDGASDSSGMAATYTVQPIVTAGTLSLSLTQSAPQMPVLVQAAFSAAGQVPSGQASFSSAGVPFATAPLDATGRATTTLTPTATGGFSIAATLLPSGLFAGATTPAQTLTVTVPLALSVSDAQVTILSGKSATDSLTLTPLSGFQGSASAQCVSPVSYVVCTVDQPGTVTGATTLTVRLSVPQSVASLERPAAGRRGLPAVGLAMLLALPLARRRWRGGLLLVLLLGVAAVGGLAGCASGGNFNAVPLGPQSVKLQVQAAGVAMETGLTVVIAK